MVEQLIPPKIPVSNRHPAGMSVQDAAREIFALRRALRAYEEAWAQLQAVVEARQQADEAAARISGRQS